MTDFALPETLQRHRPLLLACEAIGWLHMTGKARTGFLENHGGKDINYNYKKWPEQEDPPFLWHDLLEWVNTQFNLEKNAWPGTFNDFLTRHTGQNSGLLGLLQAGHAMASGIEKNLPTNTSKYLGQDATHIWLSSAFGHPVRNLLHNPPALLTEPGWECLLKQINSLLTELKRLGDNASHNEPDEWWKWRNDAVGPDGCLREAFSSTLAETRLPNNDITLFDQSYVAAALFKSAVAGAILEGKDFPWSDNGLKQKTRWRLLTVGIGTQHYEARAVKIGDWTGARQQTDEFFTNVCKLVETDLAAGSLLYRDGETCVFTFPAERFGHNDEKYKGGDLKTKNWQTWLTEIIDGYAYEANLETPPYCNISVPSRSLVHMTAEIQKARETLAVPFHRNWNIPNQNSSDGHVCPVCLVRSNGSKTDKQTPCEVCKGRRNHRLKKWLGKEYGSDTIWISEVADANDRVALVTMSLDIEPWLDGSRLDALRTQAVSEWMEQNSILIEYTKPIDQTTSFDDLFTYIKKNIASFNKNDPVLSNLQEGYRHEANWPDFFSKIVEDRSDAPKWDDLNEDKRAAWLTHQLFRKLASPGRVYRFQRQTDEFFKALLAEFGKIFTVNENRWRVKRLLLKPDKNSQDQFVDHNDPQTYNVRFGDAPLSLLYRKETDDFLTISNLARLLKPGENKEKLNEITLELKSDDDENIIKFKVASVDNVTENFDDYHPIIPLDLSPVRFRVLVPLEAASDCIDRAIEAWNEQFARVWDRLPLRIGVVAFPRMTPFQAVIEATRNIERVLNGVKESEVWKIVGCDNQGTATTLDIELPKHSQKLLKTIPVRLPDGREDVFYPYFAVVDKQIRFPLDFKHPDGQIYRHAKDLQKCDDISVYPSLITTLFIDSTARRFEQVYPRNLNEWQKMKRIWELIDKHIEGKTALRAAWAQVREKRETWQGPDGEWLAGGKRTWIDFVRAMFHERLEVRDPCLETLVEAVEDGFFEWSLEWHMSILKKQLSGGD